MRPNLRLAAWLLLAVVLFTSLVAAQDRPTVNVPISFAFAAGDHTFSAGDYAISTTSDRRLLAISHGGSTTYVAVRYVRYDTVPMDQVRFTKDKLGFRLHKVSIGTHVFDLMHSETETDL